jgi:hypothetical protein
MNQSNLHLLDLPTEILFMIMKKLDNMDVLYSLLDVKNQQLDIIAQDNTDEIFSPNDTIIDRFCINILPRIHHNVKCLVIDSLFVERIFRVADYPNLTQLKLFNFNINSAHYFRGI